MQELTLYRQTYACFKHIMKNNEKEFNVNKTTKLYRELIFVQSRTILEKLHM